MHSDDTSHPHAQRRRTQELRNGQAFRRQPGAVDDKRVVTFAICLTVLAGPVERWLDVLGRAAETYTKLKDSGLIDVIIGG